MIFETIGLLFIVGVLATLYTLFRLYVLPRGLVEIKPDLTMQALVDKTATAKGIDNETAWVLVVDKVRG